MKSYFRNLTVPTTDITAGAAVPVKDYREKCVQILGTFVADMAIQASLDDGATYGAVVASVTAPGLHSIPYACTHLRIFMTDYTSGAPAARFGGFDARSDGG